MQLDIAKKIVEEKIDFNGYQLICQIKKTDLMIAKTKGINRLLWKWNKNILTKKLNNVVYQLSESERQAAEELTITDNHGSDDGKSKSM